MMIPEQGPSTLVYEEGGYYPLTVVVLPSGWLFSP